MIGGDPKATAREVFNELHAGYRGVLIVANTKGPRNRKISADIGKVLMTINPGQIFHSSDILRKVNMLRGVRKKNPVEMSTLAGLLKGMPDVRLVSKGTWQKLESSEVEGVTA